MVLEKSGSFLCKTPSFRINKRWIEFVFFAEAKTTRKKTLSAEKKVCRVRRRERERIGAQAKQRDRNIEKNQVKKKQNEDSKKLIIFVVGSD